MRRRVSPDVARYPLVLGLLCAVNLLVATAVAFWLPPGGLPVPQPPVPGVIPVPERPPRLDQRVRQVVRQEMEQLRAPIGPGLQEVSIARFRGRPSGVDSPDARGAARQSRPGGEAGRTAFLTPFGIYRPGGPGVALAVVTLLALLTLSAFAVYLLPARLRLLRDTVAAPPAAVLRLFLLGLLGSVTLLLLAVILGFALIGIPLALVLLTVLAAATFLGAVAVSLALGRSIRRAARLQEWSPLADLSLGVLALFPLGLLPVIGWAVALAVMSLGLGAVLYTKFGSARQWTVQPLMEGMDGNG